MKKYQRMYLYYIVGLGLISLYIASTLEIVVGLGLLFLMSFFYMRHFKCPHCHKSLHYRIQFLFQKQGKCPYCGHPLA